MIVDDHLDTCALLIRLLESEGIDARCIDDPAAALRLIEALRPTLLVIDQMMPKLSGLEVLRAVRDIPSLGDVPTLFYSISEDGQEEARRLGAIDWLVKGKVTWEQLRVRVLDVYRSRTSASLGSPGSAHKKAGD